jgi:hypothetical protein
LAAPAQAKAVIPGKPLQAEQGGSGTDPNDGTTRVQDAHQSDMRRRIELDSEHGQSLPSCLDEGSHPTRHLNGFIDEQHIDRLRLPAARGRPVSAKSRSAGHRGYGQARSDRCPSRHHSRQLSTSVLQI